MHRQVRQFTALLALTLAVAACADIYAQTVPTPTPNPTNNTMQSTPLPGNLDTIDFIFDDTEYSIYQILPQDGIRPVYDPVFTTPENSPFRMDELVMGVEINGDARAYPVGFLRAREMVNDEVGGTPLLVSW